MTSSQARPRDSGNASQSVPIVAGQKLDAATLARLGVLAAMLFGFFARVYALGAKSLWLDEGLSVDFAGRPLRTIYGVLLNQDIHPPLHYLILHCWMLLGGKSEFAVRLPALAAGLLIVPATYVLAVDLIGNRRPGAKARPGTSTYLAALLATLFVAGSPFLVYYSQEARMYSELALWGVLSSLTLWRALGAEESARRLWGRLPMPSGWLVAYAATTLAGLYTHYFIGLVIAFQIVYVVLVGARQRQQIARLALGLAAAGVLYLPWIYGVYRQMYRLQTSPDFWKGELSLTFIIEKVFTAFALGKSGIPPQSLPLIATAGLLFVVGLVLLARRGLGGRRGDLFALLYLVVPLLALYAISARNPKFAERYLIVIAPVFYLVLARGLAALGEAGSSVGALLPSRVTSRFSRRGSLLVAGGRVLAVGVALVALTASTIELQRVYAGPGYEKDDNRAAIAYIQAHEQPGDTIILMMNTDHVFTYYYHGSLPWNGLHPGDDTNSAVNRLNEDLAGHQRLWLLLWQEDWADPTGFTRDLIDAHLTRLPGPAEYRGLKLILYQIDPGVSFSETLAPARPSNVNFENALTFLGFDVPAKQARAGGQVDFTLYWQARKALDQDYVASIRLRADRIDWARFDHRPAADTYPTTYWKTGRTVWGKIELPIPPGTPPGEYDVDLVVYSRDQQRDLNVLGSDGRPLAPSTTIGKLTIAPPTQSPTTEELARLKPGTPLDARFGQDLGLLGADVGAERLRPGGALDLALYWQALGASRGDDAVTVTLTDSAGQATTLVDGRPAAGRYPTTDWPTGTALIDRYHLVIPPGAVPGPAVVSVSARRLPGGEPLSTAGGRGQTIATLAISDRPAIGQRPTDIQVPLDLNIGAVAHLVGYTLTSDRLRPGGELALTLYWEARGSSPVEQKVFTHLLDANSQIWAQQDGVPAGGTNPTTGWLPGEFIRDEYRLTVKPDAPAGRYEIEIGMYDARSGQRLGVTDAAGKATGDRVLLGPVAVEK